MDFCQDFFDNLNMGWISCSDELIVAYMQFRQQRLKKPAYFVCLFLGSGVLFLGCLYNFVPMLICSCQKPCFIALHFFEACGNVRCNGCIGVAEMGFCIYIIYGGREKLCFCIHYKLFSCVFIVQLTDGFFYFGFILKADGNALL